MVKLMKDLGANINAQTSLGRTPLSKACFLGLKEIVEYLLSCPEIKISI